MALFQKKTPKRDLPETADLLLIKSGAETDIQHLKIKPFITVISVDPGAVNFGFRIERRYTDPLDGRYCSHIETLALHVVGLRWESVLPDGTKLKPKDKKGRKMTKEEQKKGLLKVTHLYRDIEDFLGQYTEIYKTADLVIVERQLPVNYLRIRIQQHIIAYFTLLHPSLIVIDQSSTVKSQFLGAPPNLTSKGLKRWSTREEAPRLLTLRGDDLALSKMSAAKTKKDDMADTVVQIEGFCVAMGLPLTNPKPDDLSFIMAESPSSSQSLSAHEIADLGFDLV